MSRSTFSGPVKSTNGFEFGASGSQITFIKKGTVAVDVPSMLTATQTDVTISIADAVVGDTVILNPPAASMTAGLLVCQAHVSAAGSVKVRIHNQSAGTIDEASATWSYALIRA